ncbi:hypothetical protein [Flavisolibacter ginsenosidimutans]|uniref:Uncharacterized protein n=1 Tax=Flavisolibacter ginsenosidimutans TaxID=661481 RepID=A0A5B8UFH1_9BACT|nr:hypothetical protein [Flavisolibacter ginsenosidimutans]QEC55248.1 hypothetical protein FSB75_04780 [Flavisolibacter ginsenosidimutans]
MIYTEIRLRWFHPGFNIGLADLKSAWLLTGEPLQLIATVHRGSLVYRIPKTRRLVSYRQLKKGLVKTDRIIRQPIYLLPF